MLQPICRSLAVITVLFILSCAKDSASPAPVAEPPGSGERGQPEQAPTAEETPVGSIAIATGQAESPSEISGETDETADPDAVLRELSEFYQQAQSMQVESRNVLNMTGGGMDNEMATRRTIAAARPNRLAIRSQGNGPGAMDLVSDGEKLITHIPMMKKYTEEEAPRSFQSLSENPLVVGMGMGLLPFALQLMTDDVYATLKEGVTASEYAGRETLEGIDVHRLRFIQEQFDWDAWIQADGDPLLVQVSIDMAKTIRQMAQHGGPFGGEEMEMTVTETFTGWKIDQPVNDEMFAFAAPPDAEKVSSFFEAFGEPELSPLVGERAPAAELHLLEGEVLSLDSHAGRDIVMLDFWATWCGPCVAEMPHLAEVAAEYQEKGVVFYAVNQGEEPNKIREFLEREELEVTVALDRESVIGDAYGVQGIPMLVLIDKEGIVQTVHVGYQPDIKGVLRQELDDLLAGKNLAEAALKARQEQEAELELEGLEEVWSVRGSFTGIAVDSETGLIYAVAGTTCMVFDATGAEQRTFPVGNNLNLTRLRTAKLSGAGETDLIGFAAWGPAVAAMTADGTELWTHLGGQGVDDVWAADLDRDGRDEVIVGYNGATGVHVFNHDGQRRWEFTGIGNVWHVTAGDVRGDGAIEVVTTSARGQVHLFDAEGKSLADLEVPLYANMVRIDRSGGDGPEPILVVGTGAGGAQMIALDGNGDVHWTLDLPRGVRHCDSLAVAGDRPWAAVGLRGGLVIVVDSTEGKILARAPGLGQRPEVAWSGHGGDDPLLLVASGRSLIAFRLTAQSE